MKKRFCLLIIVSIFCIALGFSQTNATVDLSDNVYEILRSCEVQGLCSKLSLVKPYSQSYILKQLNLAYTQLDNDERYDEAQIIKEYIDKYELEDGLNLKRGYYKLNNYNVDFPSTFVMSDSLYINIGTGLYENSNQNATGWEVFNKFNFTGDVGNHVSFKSMAILGLTKMPLETMGEYKIGYWWFNRSKDEKPRTVTTYRNNAFLPYAYTKVWDGSTYYITNLSSDGLEDWPVNTSLSFGMSGDIHAAFFDNKVEVGVGRQRREWGAMDDSSSLVLNSHARPFLGAEFSISPFDYLSISSVTGIMEFPNQSHINANAWYKPGENGTPVACEDSYFFQNAFSMTMVDIEFKDFHLDFGSTCVWPKRFELGYMFPLIDRVVYQNDVGDYDNLALFGSMKYTLEGYGSIWYSGYLDEVNVFKTKFWEKTRAMYAMQGGIKANLPFLPFTTASFRYTKVEPYCYTHHAINNTPWYNHYLSESYTNNGECLGYYLAPNSDEFNLQINSSPLQTLQVGFQYQLIRHGVDWGSRSKAESGSNLYSELQVENRGDLYKYFLRDGCYEWSNVVSIYGSYDFNTLHFPIRLYAGLGYIYDWFTDIDGEPGWNTPYHTINTDEYSAKNGVVGNISLSIFFD